MYLIFWGGLLTFRDDEAVQVSTVSSQPRESERLLRFFSRQSLGLKPDHLRAEVQGGDRVSTSTNGMFQRSMPAWPN